MESLFSSLPDEIFINCIIYIERKVQQKTDGMHEYKDPVFYCLCG